MSVAPGHGEAPPALAPPRHIRTTHHVVTADDPALERAFEVVTRSLAEPVGDPAILPTYLLAEAAREHVKVVLSGEGADELFGGYPTYLGHRATLLYLRLPRAVRRALRRTVDAWPSCAGPLGPEGARLPPKGDFKGSGPGPRAGPGVSPPQARALGARGAMAQPRPRRSGRSRARAPAALPRRPDPAAARRAPRPAPQPCSQALARARGGAVGRKVERGVMTRDEAPALVHEHTQAPALRRPMLAAAAAQQ